MLDAMTLRRFWDKVVQTETCWLWKAATRSSSSGNGLEYGQFYVHTYGRAIPAHRFAYEAFVGPIGPDIEVNHMCHVTLCVNPDHLQACTRVTNSEDQAGPSRRSKTGYRGVFLRRNGRYSAQVTHHRKAYWGGTYGTPEEANLAAIALRSSLMTNNLIDRGLSQTA